MDRRYRRSVPLPARRPSFPRLFAALMLAWRPVTASFALAAEVGHLVAAVVEWPGAPARGAGHLLAAGALGVVAMGIVFAPDRMHVLAGLAVGTLVPVAWLVGVFAGASLYRDYPLPAAAAVTAVELAAAAILAARSRSAPTSAGTDP